MDPLRIRNANTAMDRITMPSALLSGLLPIPLRGQESCQKHVVIGHRGRSSSAEDSLPDHIPRRTFLGATMISIQSTIDLRFLRIRQTHLVWHLYDGIPDIFNKLDSLRDTQAEDARRGQRAHGYLNTIESASIQRPFAERRRSPATTCFWRASATTCFTRAPLRSTLSSLPL